MLTKIMMNKWRKSVGLPKWKMSDRYPVMDGRLGAGPAPLYIRKKLCATEQIESALLDLVSGQYDEAAREISAKMQRENGVVCAADAIEKYVRG